MNRDKAEAMVTRLLTNAAGLKYGATSVTVNVHDGRIVNVVFSVTESTREVEKKDTDIRDSER